MCLLRNIYRVVRRAADTRFSVSAVAPFASTCRVPEGIIDNAHAPARIGSGSNWGMRLRLLAPGLPTGRKWK